VQVIRHDDIPKDLEAFELSTPKYLYT
jgi:hypothetical protein